MEVRSLYDFFYHGAWLPVLWTVSWQGAAAIALVWAVTRCRRRMHPHARLWIWRLVLIKMLAGLYAGAIVLSVNFSFPWPAPPPALDGWRYALLFALLGIAWMAGVMLGLLDLLRSWRLTWRLRRECREASLPALRLLLELKRQMGIPLVPELHSHPSLGPMLVDLWRPMIILPAPLLESGQPETLRAVLAHELAHLRARDLRWGWVTALAELVFFFHPLVRLAVRECLLAQEMVCDTQAIAETGQAHADYGAILVNVAAAGVARPRLIAVGVSESFTALHRRLQALAHCCPLTHWRRLGLDAALGLLALIVLTPASLLAQLLPEPEEKPARALTVYQASTSAIPAKSAILLAANPAPEAVDKSLTGDIAPPPGGLRVDEKDGAYVVVSKDPWALSQIVPDAQGVPRVVEHYIAPPGGSARFILCRAVNWCEPKLVRALLKQYPEMLVPAKDEGSKSNSPFFQAYHIDPRQYTFSSYRPFDKPGTIAALLEAGAVDVKEHDGAVLYAAEYGTPADMEALLAHGVNPNLLGPDGTSPLYIALACGYDDTAAVMRKYGAKPLVEGASIHQAAAAGDAEEVKRLLQASAQNSGALNQRRRTPLMVAVACGQVETAKILLEHGADPDKGNSHRDESPIYAAAKRGDAAMVELLLAYQADVNNRRNGSVSPLCATAAVDDDDEALNARRLAVARLLLERGADVNCADKWTSITPLQTAARNTDLTKLLLEHGAKLESKNFMGWTALFAAANAVNLPVAKLLIEHGADVNARDKDGHPILYCAVKANSVPLAELLIERGADVNAVDNAGHSLLYTRPEFTLQTEIRDYLTARGAK